MNSLLADNSHNILSYLVSEFKEITLKCCLLQFFDGTLGVKCPKILKYLISEKYYKNSILTDLGF